jgi:hypothetical protein
VTAKATIFARAMATFHRCDSGGASIRVVVLRRWRRFPPGSLPNASAGPECSRLNRPGQWKSSAGSIPAASMKGPSCGLRPASGCGIVLEELT